MHHLTLTLQTTIKYVCVALRADNNGEGGILALYALLRRLKYKWIYLLAIIGASTLLADGIITPAITVTSAIEGLESISPNLPVIPITLAIITIIFFVQRFGTESIGKSFGVFMLLWFLLLGVVGAFSITSYPLILKAFNPYYAAMLLAKLPEWFLILGAVFLCTTGAEALYSDLGHCGRKNIAITITMLMTTLLLGFYLHSKGVARIFTMLFMSAYCIIEAIFLTANLSKFLAGGWCTMLIGGILFLMMYVWVKAMKIRRHYISTKPLDDYYQIISDIKADESIPKYASNLVYVNHANKEGAVDDKLLYSIINKQPKRADHYWLINMEFVDTPDTLEYNCETLIPDTLYSVTMHIGFRIEPRVSLYLRQVVEDLVTDGKVDLQSTYPSLRKYGIPGNFRFIIIHRVYYPESSDNRQQNLLMSIYALISKIGIDEPKALGLDTSMVVVERVPLIINHPVIKDKVIKVIKDSETSQS